MGAADARSFAGGEAGDDQPRQEAAPEQSRDGEAAEGDVEGEVEVGTSLPAVVPALDLSRAAGADEHRPGSSSWHTAREKLPEILKSGRSGPPEKTPEDGKARLKKTRKAQLDTGATRRSGRAQMEGHLDTLVGLMQSEWRQISRMAPSLKSGTGVMEEALLHKLHRVAKQANLLCMKDEGAADALIQRTKRLDHQAVGLLMTMFDALDYPLLTDYIRICLTNSSKLRPVAKESLEKPRRPRQRTVSELSRDKKSPSPIDPEPQALPGPQRLMEFTKPNVKSDFKSRRHVYGNAAGGVGDVAMDKGWIAGGLSYAVRGEGQVKPVQPETRHQLISGWSTGMTGSSSLFIDPVRGHSHTPVHVPYESDDDEAVQQHVERMADLQAKIEAIRLEERQKARAERKAREKREQEEAAVEVAQRGMSVTSGRSVRSTRGRKARR